ncbi:MAG: class I SAM-dependent methyltransferase [Actinomycetia bacterium]|nr:class I SAM-dependent methyltransferase [Actinomycetes bacterium]
MSDQHRLDRVGEWLGIEWSRDQRRLLMVYQQWLLDEAMRAGGIGAGEAPRLFDRHIGDSLAFLRLIGEAASTLIDVGSGVGLPAIPIAIARPNLAVTLVDRSERRSGLAARALRILGLGNVDVRTMDIADIDDTFDITTFRASLRIEEAAMAYQRLGTQGGSGIFAWSRREQPKSPPPPPADTIFNLVSEGAGVFDSPAWLLRIQRS